MSSTTYISFGFIFMVTGCTFSSNMLNEKQNFKDNRVLRDSKDKNLELLNSTDDSLDYFGNDSPLSLTDQVRLLSKQLNALTNRRREDYKQLENSLKKSVQVTTNIDGDSVDIAKEFEKIRHEIKDIREGRSNNNKELLTVEWLKKSIAEIRLELIELQEIASNTSKNFNHHSQIFEDQATIKNDFKMLKLEVEALKNRQERTEVFINELRDETIQKEDDFRRILSKQNKANTNSAYIDIEADHRMRHQRFLRSEIHDLELSQHNLKKELNKLQYNKITERVENLEKEQRRLANANFNLSRQIAGLDKLHVSMLELLEDVEGIQNKIDKTIPDIKHELSRLEFTSAQLNSEQNLLKEEGHNAARSIQAMAVSISVLQEKRSTIKDMKNEIDNLSENIEQFQSASNIHKSIVKERIEKIDSKVENKQNNKIEESRIQTIINNIESIINKLPADCSLVDYTARGIYLIAPAGQHRPTMVPCNNGYTTIQKRFDGSVDFNRSWEEYANGFGSPSGEYWIGNDILYHLTIDNCTQLKIIIQDIYDNTWEAVYENFLISSRDDGYRLHINGYKGNASDALDYQNEMQFSAIDIDRDISNTHCAANYEGGWWFSHCQHANLNGRYNLGLTWFDGSRNEWIAVKSSHMMITKRKNCIKVATTTATTSIV